MTSHFFIAVYCASNSASNFPCSAISCSRTVLRSESWRDIAAPCGDGQIGFSISDHMDAVGALAFGIDRVHALFGVSILGLDAVDDGVDELASGAAGQVAGQFLVVEFIKRLASPAAV